MKAKASNKPRSRLRFLGWGLIALVLILAITVIWKLPSTDVPDAATENKIRDYAQAHGLSYEDYPQSLIELLERNPETETFVLEYPIASRQTFAIDLSEYQNCQTVPLFLQWDQRWGYMTYGSDVAGLTACGPTCLAMVGYYLTGDSRFSPDEMIRFAIEEGYCVKGSGTAWTLFSKGAQQLGLTSRELESNPEHVRQELEAGNPIVCIMGPGDFTTGGHFIVLRGWEDGKVLVNDPNSRANSQKAWEFADIQGQIRNLWAITQ